MLLSRTVAMSGPPARRRRGRKTLGPPTAAIESTSRGNSMMRVVGPSSHATNALGESSNTAAKRLPGPVGMDDTAVWGVGAQFRASNENNRRAYKALLSWASVVSATADRSGSDALSQKWREHGRA